MQTNFRNFLNKRVPADDLRQVTALLKKHLAGQSDYFACEHRTIGMDQNQEKWAYVRGRALFTDGMQAVRMAGSVTDITERKRTERKAEELAYYDVVTGLPNRVQLNSFLAEELRECQVGQCNGAVFLLISTILK